jgi:hypothetical protein
LDDLVNDARQTHDEHKQAQSKINSWLDQNYSNHEVIDGIVRHGLPALDRAIFEVPEGHQGPTKAKTHVQDCDTGKHIGVASWVMASAE